MGKSGLKLSNGMIFDGLKIRLSIWIPYISWLKDFKYGIGTNSISHSSNRFDSRMDILSMSHKIYLLTMTTVKFMGHATRCEFLQQVAHCPPNTIGPMGHN